MKKRRLLSAPSSSVNVALLTQSLSMCSIDRSYGIENLQDVRDALEASTSKSEAVKRCAVLSVDTDTMTQACSIDNNVANDLNIKDPAATDCPETQHSATPNELSTPADLELTTSDDTCQESPATPYLPTTSDDIASNPCQDTPLPTAGDHTVQDTIPKPATPLPTQPPLSHAVHSTQDTIQQTTTHHNASDPCSLTQHPTASDDTAQDTRLDPAALSKIQTSPSHVVHSIQDTPHPIFTHTHAPEGSLMMNKKTKRVSCLVKPLKKTRPARISSKKQLLLTRFFSSSSSTDDSS